MKTASLLGVFLLLWVGIAPVLSCSPTVTAQADNSPNELTIEDYARQEAVIFVGTVIRELEPTGDIWGNRVYEIHVERYLKDEGFDTVYITGYGNGTDCSPMISVEMQSMGIFFMQEHENSAGIPVYSRYNDYSHTAEREAVVTAITGQSLPAQPLPLDWQIARVAEQTDFRWLFIVCAGLALVTSISLAWKWRSQRRKPKHKREESL